MIRVADHPQLSLLAWSLRPDDQITEQEALALYERNWALVDKNAMDDDEKAFLQELVKNHGNGCFNAL